jgi:hypothetical protein
MRRKKRQQQSQEVEDSTSHHPFEGMRARSNSQMISIVQTKPTPRRLELLGCQTLETSLCSDGHEDGQLDGAMWQVEGCCSGFGRLYCVRVSRDIAWAVGGMSGLGWWDVWRGWTLKRERECEEMEEESSVVMMMERGFV